MNERIMRTNELSERKNTYSFYETNVPNILGGYCCYNSFEKAVESGATKIYLVTSLRKANNLGIEVNALTKRIWRDLIWENKNSITKDGHLYCSLLH